jgi:hypothetical protein
VQVTDWQVSIAAHEAPMQVKKPSQVDEPWHDGFPVMVGSAHSGPL